MDDTIKATQQAYEGAPGATRQEAIHYTCKSCGSIFGARVYRSINVATDPRIAKLLEQGELNTLVCSACDEHAVPAVPLLYHDPHRLLMAIVLPESMRHEELQARTDLLQALASDPADVPAYTKAAPVVFGPEDLVRWLKETQPAGQEEPRRSAQARRKLQEQENEIERREGEIRRREGELARREGELGQQRQELERRQAELDKQRAGLALREEELLAREEDIHVKQEDLLSHKAKLLKAKDALGKGWAEVEREREAVRALSLDLQAKEQMLRERIWAPQPAREIAEQEEAQSEEVLEAELPQPLELEGRPQAEVDRWRASDTREGFVMDQGRAFLLARPGTERLDRFQTAELVPMIQLFEFPAGPVIVLIVTLANAERPLEDLLFWILNPASTADRDLLTLLSNDFTLHLDLYDDESRPASTRDLVAPLKENVEYILQRAELQLDAAEEEALSFQVAARSYMELGEERLGRKQHNFAESSFAELPSPAAARLALGIVSYWAERENQDYLVLVKSFPIPFWREIRIRVIRKALDFGLALIAPLMDFALGQKLAPSRESLLRTLLSSFAEVSLRLKPSDLDPTQEWENWKLLLAACAEDQVAVDPQIEELAASAAKRANPEQGEVQEGGDLGLLAEEELIPLLTEREVRRDAALELLERRDSRYLEPVFNAVCNMTRSEVARVLPAMVQAGDQIIPLLVQGLRHRKSFVRQGCALTLGALRADGAIEPLMETLLNEPTNVWKEAARALGDMGHQALGGLIAGVKAADGEGRERIAWAFAQASLNEEMHVEVEAMTRGRSSKLAKVASRALEVLDQVSDVEAEIRGKKPLGDQTIVRSFSKRFFEALSGEVSELSEEDILEQEEVLDDSYILEEEVAVQEEDIVAAIPGSSRKRSEDQ